ncbi:hypothetical protein VFPBJ_01301 [Purpureocillium lilacinum]|uniref:Uncharacterized protein n=1 Tax=Purpureocillium lilacinum TaxID=33203 RepID=A0A179HCJ2_PURLI|nr:hypothetical protein VFPBJ_01301 [Purpureocillium lilacinum]
MICEVCLSTHLLCTTHDDFPMARPPLSMEMPLPLPRQSTLSALEKKCACCRAIFPKDAIINAQRAPSESSRSRPAHDA